MAQHDMDSGELRSRASDLGYEASGEAAADHEWKVSLEADVVDAIVQGFRAAGTPIARITIQPEGFDEPIVINPANLLREKCIHQVPCDCDAKALLDDGATAHGVEIPAAYGAPMAAMLGWDVGAVLVDHETAAQAATN